MPGTPQKSSKYLLNDCTNMLANTHNLHSYNVFMFATADAE